jgi:O-antigen/teichoic acid export membrane protein
MVDSARHWHVAGSSWLGRAIAGGMQFLSLGLLLRLLGADQFAAFGLLYALLGWASLVDLGTGSSVQNGLSTRRASGRQGHDLVGAAATIIGCSLISGLVLLALLAPSAGPAYLDSIESLNAGEQAAAFFIAGMLALLSGAGSIVLRVWYAEDRGHWSNLLPALAATAGCAALWWLGSQGRPSLQACLVVMMAPMAILSISSLAFRLVEVRWREVFTRKTFAEVMQRAWKFWLFALIAAVVLQMDALVISQTLTPADIAAYTLASKCFGIVLILYSGLMSAIWPTLSEYAATDNSVRFQALMATSLKIGIGLTAVATLVLAFTLEPLARWLDTGTGSELHFPLSLFLAFGAYLLLRMWTDVHATALQSLTLLRPFWIWVPAQAAITAAAMLLFIPWMGISGVVAGLLAGSASTVAWALPRALAIAMRTGVRP